MALRRITWISPTGAGHTAALISAVMVLIFMVAFVLFMVVSSLRGRPMASPGEALMMIILLPVGYYAFGWVMGYVTASAFNLTSRLTRGLEVEFAEDIQPSKSDE